jgi:carbon-monoxide dehydrogenase large subunit
VEVEVDPATGAVRILRYVVVSDCGRQINPMIVEGQITGGVVHGIGNALFERMVYDETAQPVSTNFADYLLPSATELPLIELISHVSPSPLNPLGVKGVGECGVIPAAAAIISAIEHALDAFGVHIAETPIERRLRHRSPPDHRPCGKGNEYCSADSQNDRLWNGKRQSN